MKIKASRNAAAAKHYQRSVELGNKEANAMELAFLQTQLALDDDALAILRLKQIADSSDKEVRLGAAHALATYYSTATAGTGFNPRAETEKYKKMARDLTNEFVNSRKTLSANAINKQLLDEADAQIKLVIACAEQRDLDGVSKICLALRDKASDIAVTGDKNTASRITELLLETAINFEPQGRQGNRVAEEIYKSFYHLWRTDSWIGPSSDGKRQYRSERDQEVLYAISSIRRKHQYKNEHDQEAQYRYDNFINKIPQAAVDNIPYFLKIAEAPRRPATKHHLAKIYLAGSRGVGQSEAKAVELFILAADMGYQSSKDALLELTQTAISPEAQYKLSQVIATLLADELGKPGKDAEKIADELLKKAAIGGHKEAGMQRAKNKEMKDYKETFMKEKAEREKR